MKKTFFVVFFVLLVASVKSQVVQSDTLRVKDSMDFRNVDDVFRDSEVLKMFESLGSIPYFGKEYLFIDSSEMNRYGYAPSEVPVFADSIYSQRIDRLASQTTLPLVYNAQVRHFIDLYAVQRRSLTSRMLGLSHVYFPLFEETLDRYNMPLELKYLAMIESALNPTAGSHMGAKGLWQFMYQTGKQYGLKSNTMIEERYDPVKATDAACRCLLDLYARYNDWFLALAAYNAGPGTINKAIVRAGGATNYWAVWPYLPRETQSYVPCFIAVYYVVSYAPEHNLYPLDPGLLMSGTDTVEVCDVLSFRKLNETIGVPMEDLRTFNPQYIKEIIPATDSTRYVLRMPTQYILHFVEKESEIYAYKTQEDLDKENVIKEVSKENDRIVHTVKKGETLASIAKKYHVSVANLKKWNNLKQDTLKVGQKLTVYTAGGPATKSSNNSKSTNSKSTNSKSTNTKSTNSKSTNTKSSNSKSNNSKSTNTKKNNSSSPKYHEVKAGDTLESIARKYNTTVANLKKLNNLKSDTIKVKQKIRVS